MVSLAKKRIDADAAQNGAWIDDIQNWKGVAVYATASDTDACIKRRQELVAEIYGDEDFNITDRAMRDYVNLTVIIDAAIKSMRGLTDDLGKTITYSANYLKSMVFRKQAKDAPVKTPDGLEYDPAAKEIYTLLIEVTSRAGSIREGSEKKPLPAGSAGGAASAPASATSTPATSAETASPTDSSKAPKSKKD